MQNQAQGIIPTTVQWEDPPSRDNRARGEAYRHLFEQLMERPGEWGVVYEGKRPHQKRSQIKGYACVPPGAWEWRAVGTGTAVAEQVGKVYARYLGPSTNGSAH